ncbi:17349_t:CDS:2, partial [Dentiscutata erythropus]
SIFVAAIKTGYFFIELLIGRCLIFIIPLFSPMLAGFQFGSGALYSSIFEMTFHCQLDFAVSSSHAVLIYVPATGLFTWLTGLSKLTSNFMLALMLGTQYVGLSKYKFFMALVY